jgi:hypothetical protein
VRVSSLKELPLASSLQQPTNFYITLSIALTNQPNITKIPHTQEYWQKCCLFTSFFLNVSLRHLKICYPLLDIWNNFFFFVFPLWIEAGGTFLTFSMWINCFLRVQGNKSSLSGGDGGCIQIIRLRISSFTRSVFFFPLKKLTWRTTI